jgi:hypothetical protein
MAFSLGTPAIRIQVAPPIPEELDGESWVEIVLEADYLAKDVALNLEGEAHGFFEENFFNLLPGRPRTIRIFTELTPQEVESALRIRTLAEIPQEGIPAAPSTTDSASVVLGALVDPVLEVGEVDVVQGSTPDGHP